jgi:hypothetical protein
MSKSMQETAALNYAAFLRKRADECGPGLRRFFLDQAAKCEADPNHERITRAILSAGKQAGRLMKEGKV